MTDAILERAGVSLYKTDHRGEIVRNNDGRPMTRQPGNPAMSELPLLEMIRRLYMAAGVPEARDASASRLLGIVKTRSGTSTVSLPNVLSGAMHRSLMANYIELDPVWPLFGVKRSAMNFKEQSVINTTEFESLEKINPAGEYTYATMEDAAETVTLAKYGKMFGFTWESMINDNLNAFDEIPRKQAQAARRLEDTLALGILTSNAVIGEDSINLFHASHGNYVASGSGAAPSIATLNAGRLAMRKQMGLGDHAYLNLMPAVFIGPAALEPNIDDLIEQDKDPADTDKVNTWKGKLFKIIHPLLDESSSTMWYLAVDPRIRPLVLIWFLNGVTAPTLEQQSTFENDTYQYKVRHVVAACVGDYRAGYCNYGA